MPRDRHEEDYDENGDRRPKKETWAEKQLRLKRWDESEKRLRKLLKEMEDDGGCCA